VAEERNAEQIQREIEQSRAALASAVDQLAYRTDPKRIADQTKQRLLDKAQTTQGRIVIGAAGALVLLLVVRRIRKGGKSD
jgi:hypothetical protein